MKRDEVPKLIQALTPLPAEHTICGWYRRGDEEGHSLNIVVPHNGWVDRLQDLPINIESTGRLSGVKGDGFIINGTEVNFIPTEDEYHGAMLLHLTGNMTFTKVLRGIAKQKGLLLSQYGLFDHRERIAGNTEYSVFYMLDLEYVPPSKRSIQTGYRFIETKFPILKRR